MQIEELLDVNKEDNHQSIMEAALEIASKEMATLVSLRDQQLKVRHGRAVYMTCAALGVASFGPTCHTM